MATDEIIIRLFCIVDDRLSKVKKHPEALLYPSEIVTLGLLFSLRGGKWRAFYRWLVANYRSLFPNIPEQSRLFRLIYEYGELVEEWRAEVSTFSILDTFGIELIHPRREGRSPKQVGRKGISNGRWIVGIKVAWLVNRDGAVVSWAWDTADTPDNAFREVGLAQDGRSIVVCDNGFRMRGEDNHNLKICARGTWNERFAIETTFSWLTELLHAKKIAHRAEHHITRRLAYLAALLNCLLQIAPTPRSLAQFVI
jgi:hypothetical protein